jgi:hypothetical protein
MEIFKLAKEHADKPISTEVQRIAALQNISASSSRRSVFHLLHSERSERVVPLTRQH